MTKTPPKYTPEQIEDYCKRVEEGVDVLYPRGGQGQYKAVLIIRQLQEPKEVDMEVLAAAVHDAYCRYYIKTHNKPYWTKGDYNLLDEDTKEIDRETVRAVLRQIAYLNRICGD